MDDLQKKKREESGRNNSPEQTSRSPATGTTKAISGDVDSVRTEHVTDFFKAVGAFVSKLPGESSERRDFYSDLLRGLIKVEAIARGKLTCLLSVVPGVLNTFDGLHGGMVAMVAERAAEACARTVVAEDKQLILAELSISYLSAASLNHELVVEAAVAKTGRNMTVVTVEIARKKNRGKPMYLSHATFFHASPISKL